MQGHQSYQPQLFSVFSMEALIPEDHLLRKIDKKVSFEFVREMTAPLYCQDNGRPSIDPVLFLRICLITHLYNIPSDRQVCEEIRYNLAYRWFCRLSIEDSVPDHSSLTRIRDRLGEATFKSIFDHLIRLCIESGLVKGNKVMMDGSLVKADAAREAIELRPTEEGESESSVRKIKTAKFSNETHRSKTDPDSSLAGSKHQPKAFFHKVHAAIDRDSRIILDAHVTTGTEQEGKVMFSRIDHLESTFNFRIDELTADRGYGYGINLNELEMRGIHSFVPNFHENVGENIDPNLFKYDEATDSFTCPQGHRMNRQTSNINEKKQHARRYQVAVNCRKCPNASQCFDKPPTQSYARKVLVRNLYWESQERTKAQEKTWVFRGAKAERQWKMEGVFAEAKNNHGLKRARYRGRAKMQIQAYMIAVVQNLKRMTCERPAMEGALCQFAVEGVVAIRETVFNFWIRFTGKFQIACHSN